MFSAKTENISLRVAKRIRSREFFSPKVFRLLRHDGGYNDSGTGVQSMTIGLGMIEPLLAAAAEKSEKDEIEKKYLHLCIKRVYTRDGGLCNLCLFNAKRTVFFLVGLSAANGR